MADVRIIHNVEKAKHQHWGDADHPIEGKYNYLNFPQPFRFLTVAQPNCGKTSALLTILLNLKPIPKNIFILHPETIDYNKRPIEGEGDSYYINEDTPRIKEYENIKAIYLNTIPDLKFMKKYKKDINLLIIDDVNIRQLVKNDSFSMNTYDKMLSYASTHYNFSIMQCFQNLFQQALPSTYRYSNILLMFKYDDIFMMRRLFSSFGVCRNDSDQIMQFLKQNNNGHNSILINNQPGSPYKYLLNLKHILAEEDDSDND